MSAVETLLANNRRYAEHFDDAAASGRPSQRVAVLSCMDARLDLAAALGLTPGDAHVIRNAGGQASEDVIRSLMISQRLLGTVDLMVIHHTECGLLALDEEAAKDRIQAETGTRPTFPLGAFASLQQDVRDTAGALAVSPLLRFGVIRGFVFDVKTGRLQEVSLA